ncbi:MAG: leucyl aminopeptidase, partial [Planctomycetota bacterium]
MKLTVRETPAALPVASGLVVFAFEGEKPELPRGVEVPKQAWSTFKGEFREVRVTDAVRGRIGRVIAIGLGKQDALDAERWRRVAAVAVQRCEANAIDAVLVRVERDLAQVAGPERTGHALAEGLAMGAYRFEAGKSKPKEEKLKSVTLLGSGREFLAGARRGAILAEANCFVRDLQNMPGNRMTPTDLARAAKSLAKRGRITCTVLDERDMRRLGMGLLLGVARGSREKPRLIHLAYKPRGKSRGVVAFVGKGLTFDAGGISIKPSAKMDEMRFDMSGGGAVLGVFHALAHLDVPYEVHGVVPSTENLPGGAATKPGDIHVAMNGTTVEVLNTDAEGRLILADALCYTVKKIAPDTIIDLATLTGAVVTALGHELTGMFASTDKLRDELRAAGEETGERVWPLPLLDLHKEAMKGLFADLKNISGGDMGAGSSAGAAFLAPFVGNVEWAHLDIAGTAYGTSARDWSGGPMGTGVGTRLLIRWLAVRAS